MTGTEDSQHKMSGLAALAGINIMDLTRIGPGPYCTMMLGDLGAEVIKVEAPLTGGARQAGFRTGTDEAHQSFNRNKRSIVLDLKSEKGRHICLQLAKRADVIIEGFRPGVARRLGVDYQAVSSVNPTVIYCSITGYGQDGPYRDLPGHDINYIAMGGALGLIGNSDGRPTIPLNLIADMGAGLHAATGILSALVARNKTGRGQYVDISMTDSVISFLTYITAYYFQSGVEPKRGETYLSGAYPYYNVYETKDGRFLAIGCLEPWLWENLCREMGRPDFSPFHFKPDHRLRKPQGEKWEEISSYLKQIFLTRTRDEWFNLLSKKDIAVSKVYSLSEAFSDPQVRCRNMVLEIEHPETGKVRQVGAAIKLSDTPAGARRLPPKPGEHTREILEEIGYTEQGIDELQREGAVG
ncbi:MAG: CoA transferase [Chloroflexi bacterium]|nr:CoA transferase [Chloroflexota bacterium]